MKHLIIAAAILATVTGCQKMTAQDACTKLEATGAIKACEKDTPGGLGAAAIEASKASLVNVPGKGCGVMKFSDEGAFSRTVDAFQAAAMLAGPHRYGNKSKLIFVQCNDGTSAADGAKIKAAVDAL